MYLVNAKIVKETGMPNYFTKSYNKKTNRLVLLVCTGYFVGAEHLNSKKVGYCKIQERPA